MTQRRLSGWGRTAWTTAEVVTRTDDLMPRARSTAESPRGSIARGLGRAYGAAAQNSGGVVLDMTVKGVGDIDMDPNTGVVTVDAGVSVDELLKFSVPRGWFVPVTPGTRFVTIGGAIASDIHGKNHHRDGSFGNHVYSLDILLSDGNEVRLSPETSSRYFWATVGGMGLTGVILRATFQMIPIESSLVEVETIRFNDLDAGLKLMSSEADDDFRYSVAWIDITAGGVSLGRGILTRGDHASAKVDKRKNPLKYDPKVRLSIPPIVPNWLLNPITIKMFNELWFRRSPRKPTTSLETIPAFFHPLDGVRQWNRIYGTRGFIQYQIIVPFSHTDTLRQVVNELSQNKIGSFLAVLKRMGTGNGAPMSFPSAGWTLTVDIASGTRGLGSLLARLDDLVLSVGGRHYLAKDAHVTAVAVERGYSALADWKAIRREMDPARAWNSDLARRLGLVE